MYDPMVRLRSVNRVFARGRHYVGALRNVNLEVDKGEFVAVVGPSGSGKTTLLNVIGGLDWPTSGDVSIGGRLLGSMARRELAHYRRDSIGFIFQFYNLMPYLTAVENVEVPLMLSRVPRAVRRHRAADLLASLGLGERLHHKPSELSGGEQQRVAIARALANSPRLILGDEPTGDLDGDATQEVVGLLRRLNVERHLTIVVVTHNSFVAAAADRVIRMRDGYVMKDKSEDLPEALELAA